MLLDTNIFLFLFSFYSNEWFADIFVFVFSLSCLCETAPLKLKKLNKLFKSTILLFCVFKHLFSECF